GDRRPHRRLDAGVEHGSIRRGRAERRTFCVLQAKLLMKALLFAISGAILGCSSAQLGTARIDAVLAALVPADTIMLSGIRMNELRSTPLYNKLLSQQRLSELDDFAKQTNFDPRKDVNDLLIASNGVETVVQSADR